MRKVGIIVVAACLMAGANAALGVSAVGDPFEAGSWGQRFIEDGVGQFDQMQFKMISGGPFEAPGIGNFAQTPAGWSQAFESADKKLLVAVGPASTSLQFDIVFQGLKTTALKFNFQAYSPSGTLVENTDATWNGSGWSFGAGSVSGGEIPVPEPITMLSCFLAISGLGMYVRKHTRKTVAQV
jgi:hypothetical protein